MNGPLTGALIVGGKSNLTYAVTDGLRTGVLRRPPLGHVPATADDMAREYRVLTALAPTVVPVPRTVVINEHHPPALGAVRAEVGEWCS